MSVSSRNLLASLICCCCILSISYISYVKKRKTLLWINKKSVFYTDLECSWGRLRDLGLKFVLDADKTYMLTGHGHFFSTAYPCNQSIYAIQAIMWQQQIHKISTMHRKCSDSDHGFVVWFKLTEYF